MKQSKQSKCYMNSESDYTFAKEVEKLVDPISVGTIHFIQQLYKILPKQIQRKIMKSSSQQTPNMGFVVEPYASFLCYEIKDLDKAKKLLPDSFRLIKTRIFDDDEPKYYCILSSFNVHTSAFWGSRSEFYVIAEDTRTNLLSWIIIDYDSNTISYDSKRGLASPNSKSVITTNHRGELYVDIANIDNDRKCSYNYNVEDSKMKKLDQRLWLEGNLSVGHGRDLSDANNSVFSLKFEPCEVEKALSIDPNNVHNLKNTWYADVIKSKPSVVACFPYAQHFISDSPGYSSNIKNENELIASVKSIDFSKIKVFSTKSITIMFAIGTVFSFILTITLLVLLVIK